MFLSRIRERGQEWWDGHKDWAQLAMLSHGPWDSSSPGHLSETCWPEMAGATQVGSPFLSYTTATAWLSIPPKSRVKPSAYLLCYNTICWQGGKIPSCRRALNRLRSPFSSRLCPEALLSASIMHDKGLSGTTENLCQQKSDPAQKGGVPRVRNTTLSTARDVFSVTRPSGGSKRGLCWQ